MQQAFLAPIETGGRSAPEVIFRRLSEAIATGELQAGDRLPSEADLAALLGVAVMTLRRALEMLRDVGLIETKRGRQGGNFVSPRAGDHIARLAKKISFTRQEVRELTDWRRAISGEACYLAAERGLPPEFEAVVTAADEFDRFVVDLSSMRVADAKLHLAIAQAAHSARLHKEEAEIQVELSKLVLSVPYSDQFRFTLTGLHDNILKALTARDAELARAELLIHVEETFNWCIALIQK